MLSDRVNAIAVRGKIFIYPVLACFTPFEKVKSDLPEYGIGEHILLLLDIFGSFCLEFFVLALFEEVGGAAGNALLIPDALFHNGSIRFCR